MVNRPEHHGEVDDKNKQGQASSSGSELAVGSVQSLNDVKAILQNSDQLASGTTDQFLPAAESIIADAQIAQRGIEGQEQAWAQGKIPPMGDYNGSHQSEDIVVRWPPGYDPREHAGEQFGEPTRFGNQTVNLLEIPPVPGKSNYWNALANPHIDANGHLVGIPMHIERGPNKILPNGQVVKGDVVRFVNSNINVSCENHYPKKHAQKTADA